MCRSKDNYERVREWKEKKWIFDMYTNITSKWKHPKETIIYFHLFSKRMFTLRSAWPVHVHDGLVSKNLICTTEMITIFSRICTFIVRKHIICTGFKNVFFCNDSNWNYENLLFLNMEIHSFLGWKKIWGNHIWIVLCWIQMGKTMFLWYYMYMVHKLIYP